MLIMSRNTDISSYKSWLEEFYSIWIPQRGVPASEGIDDAVERLSRMIYLAASIATPTVEVPRDLATMVERGKG